MPLNTHHLATDDPVTRLCWHAKHTPDAIAVHDQGKNYTYQECVEWMARLAASIRQHAQPNRQNRILINTAHGINSYIAMFATLMAGGFYSIINQQWPTERIDIITKRFMPDLILSDNAPLLTTTIKTVSIDINNHTTMLDSAYNGQTAYVLFTSGSTGIPKGVQIERHSLAHYLNWVTRAIGYKQGDRAAQHPNPAFDASVTDIFGALCGGATLYPFNTTLMRTMPARAIRDNAITVWNSVPSVINLMIAAQQCNNDHLNTIRFFNFCGEALHVHQTEALHKAAPQAVIQNTYGPTEATVACTEIIVNSSAQPANEATISLGAPIDGMHILIEGQSDKPGEIIIAGPQVAAGYWMDPETTAKAFTTRTINGKTMPAYRTGDLAERVNGLLFFRGRLDRQVKINGYRVELAEIEKTFTALTGQPSYALLYHDKLAVLVETEQLPQPQEDLLKQAALTLPPYAIPHLILPKAMIPRNFNDKADMAAMIAYLDRVTHS